LNHLHLLFIAAALVLQSGEVLMGLGAIEELADGKVLLDSPAITRTLPTALLTK